MTLERTTKATTHKFQNQATVSASSGDSHLAGDGFSVCTVGLFPVWMSSLPPSGQHWWLNVWAYLSPFLRITLQERWCYPHFTKEEIQAKGMQEFAQRHTEGDDSSHTGLV